jgi:hypothetical protein
MEKIGIDLHKVATQVCIMTEDGEFKEFRIRTERDSLTETFGRRVRARILLEAATESEWVARHLEALGHTDPLEAGLAIARAFDAATIPYALGGALAYGIRAIPRATLDVDVNVFVEDAELGRVADALRSLGSISNV